MLAVSEDDYETFLPQMAHASLIMLIDLDGEPELNTRYQEFFTLSSADFHQPLICWVIAGPGSK